MKLLSMKKIVLMTGALLLLSTVLTNNAHARKLTFFVAPELDLAVAPDEVVDYYSKGIGGALGFDYALSTKLSLVWTANYKTFSPDEKLLTDLITAPDEYPGATNISVEDGTIYTAVISVVAKAKLKGKGSSFWPYVKAGAGVSVVGADEIIVNFTDAGSPMQEFAGELEVTTAPSLLAAFGLELKRGGNGSFFVEVGIEVHYLTIPADGIDPESTLNLTAIPIRLGFSF